MAEVLFSVESGEGRITINRPEKSNALSREMLKEMRRVLHKAGQDPAIRVITITGAGDKVFCAGVDLKASRSADSGQDFGRSDFRQLLIEIVRCPKPTITLVRGHVMGGGVGIVLASDLCLASSDVHFSTPEIQVGMFPMMVMGLLYRNVGRKKATEMMFLGERMTALEAQELGMINHAYNRDQFESAAREFLQKLIVKSSTILKMGKEAISRVLDAKLAGEEQFLESALAEVMATDDSREGIRAFLEKRPPKWN
ncbi:MAG: enoyl-CoA hydratase/isomerase family protein [Acidobacteriota bacterium]|jgi:enoyl-CoA hydratase/carnithine racemase